MPQAGALALPVFFIPHDGHRRPDPWTKKEVFCSQEKTGSPGTGAQRPACTAGRSQLPVLDLPGNQYLLLDKEYFGPPEAEVFHGDDLLGLEFPGLINA